MLPNWIIAGAPKAGTSSLFRWLVDHPQVSGSREKETYYFVDPGTHMYRPDRNLRANGLPGYQEFFSHCEPSARVIVESTPGYMYASTALTELPRLPTRPDLVFVLRDPVEQIKSLFVYFQQNWNWIPRTLTFRDFVAALERRTAAFNGNELAADALENADYLAHLRRWKAACGAERMHVVLFEDMVRDKCGFMRAMASRMGIDPAFYDDYAFPAENVSYAVRSGVLQDVNIRVRALVPQGRMYRALRRLYRAMNTAPAPSRQVCDAETEQKLSRRYASMLDDLEREFDLDLTSWRGAFRARIEQQGEEANGMRLVGPRPDVARDPVIGREMDRGRVSLS